MANPLFDQLVGGRKTASQAPKTANMDERMAQLRANPGEAVRQAGYNVPDEITGNPQAIVMHLIQTGQVGGALMQRIQPMLSMLTGRR